MDESALPAAAPLSCLIVGCGYVGARLARRESGRRPLLAIVRSGPSETELSRTTGVLTMRLDLDATDQLLQPTLADAARDVAIVYLVPPPGEGTTDPRLEAFLQDLGDATPAVFVYVSTTGVYGDAAGTLVDETTPLQPASDRARRRVAAESAVTAWCSGRGVRCVVLRVPGIYGPHRLPLDRLQRHEPALRPADAGPGNRIHVDDLVSAIVAAIDSPAALGAYNVSDGDHSSTTAYLQATADAAGLPPPELVSESEAVSRISPGLRTFLDESRRVSNRRMLEDLGVTLRYPGMHLGILASLAEMRMEDSAP
jgi:nucleoside-diphosphate-sugar epimerase